MNVDVNSKINYAYIANEMYIEFENSFRDEQRAFIHLIELLLHLEKDIDKFVCSNKTHKLIKQVKKIRQETNNFKICKDAFQEVIDEIYEEI